MAFYLIVIGSKQIVNIGSSRHNPELFTVRSYAVAEMCRAFLLFLLI